MQGSLRPRYEANIWKLYLFQFFINFQLWWPIWVIYLQEERGLSLGQVALLDVPFWLSIVFLQIPAAAIADRWGRKPTLMTGALLMSLAVTLFGLASSLPLLLTSYLIWGMAIVLMTGPDSAFLYDTLRALGRESEYQKLYGRAWGVVAAGGLLGTLIGAPLADATSLPFPIVLSGGIALASVLIALSFQEPLTSFRSELLGSYRGIIGESMRIVARQPEVRYAIFFFGTMTVATIAPIFFFQPFLVRHDISLDFVGLWQTPARIAAILGALLAYRGVALLGERRSFVLMPVVAVACLALLAAVDSLYAVVAFPVLSFISFATRPTITDYLNRRVGTAQRATVVSLTNLAYSLALVPTAPLLGTLADKLSPSAGYSAGAAIVAIPAAAVLFLWFRIRVPEAARVPAEAEAEGPALPSLP